MSEELANAAWDHYNDIAPKGLLSHTGSNKSTYKDRIEKYCKWGGSIFEAIDYGTKETAKDVVITWLVDDGVPKRVHRMNLLNKEHKYLGVAKGDHKVAEQCVIAVFAA
ncbi:Allergen V5/Tpx-1 family protein [mine drainage metagenome]|uniref:Allergen V5/Tpx-1 family protein n=1 Tax=mine drainage metagenome TaxID=410659 RepID=T1A2X8_9ZZZZ